jgi:hypothetical protein
LLLTNIGMCNQLVGYRCSFQCLFLTNIGMCNHLFVIGARFNVCF